MKSITYARYILSLASGSVSDSIRTDYLNDLTETELGAPLFGNILSTIVKILSDGTIDIDAAKALINTEYIKCNINEKIGEYSKYENYINAILDQAISGSDRLERCKALILEADTIDLECIKIGTYSAVLDQLVVNFLVLKDKEFSEKVTNYVYEIDNSETGAQAFKSCAECALITPVTQAVE